MRAEWLKKSWPQDSAPAIRYAGGFLIAGFI